MRKLYLYAMMILLATAGGSVNAQTTVRASEIPEAAGSIKATLAEKAPVQTYPPGIMFATLLNNVRLVSRNGRITLGNQMLNVFMPDGATGKAVISREDGSEFCHWKWKLDTFGSRPPYKRFGYGQPLTPDGSNFNYNNLRLTKPGNYVVDFFIADKRFYTFPFSITTVEPANPFDGKTLYFVEGAWNDWGYLNYREADPEQNLRWKVWLRKRSHKRSRNKVRVEITRDKDKKLICQSRENTTHSFRNEWVRYNFDMVNPPVKTSGGAYFKAKDLLRVDGGYTLTMKIDGAMYGVWKFNVVGGKLDYRGQTKRGIADTLTFVEGGKEAWWYKREKSR